MLVLPNSYDSNLELANAFAGYFKAKVDTIVSEFEPFVASNCEAISGVVCFKEFLEVPVEEVSKLRKLKTSESDPLILMGYSILTSQRIDQDTVLGQQYYMCTP